MSLTKPTFLALAIAIGPILILNGLIRLWVKGHIPKSLVPLNQLDFAQRFSVLMHDASRRTAVSITTLGVIMELIGLVGLLFARH